MPDGIDVARLVGVVAICAAFAILGTLLAGDALKTWYPTLARPRFALPTPAFAAIGGVFYLIEAIVLYRLLGRLPASDVAVAITALLVVMLYNELWNGALFRLRSPFAAYIGLLGFLAPIAILEVALVVTDPGSALLMAAYVAWVVGYDVPWFRRLAILNPGTTSPPS